MSFQQGLSGLNGAAKSLDVIGNNIANASTVGFKSAQAQFADVYAGSLVGATGKNAGIGVSTSAIAQQFTQGNVESTNNPLDIAINGGGFFRTEQNGVAQYSRNGQFTLDKNGFMENAQGAKLTGYGVSSTGNILAGSPAPIQISTADIAPVPTTKVDTQMNLNSGSAVKSVKPFNADDPNSYEKQVPIDVYDSLGNSHVMSTYYVKTDAGKWDVYVATDGVENTNQAVAGAAQGTSAAYADVNAKRDAWVASSSVVPPNATQVASDLAAYAQSARTMVSAAATAAGASATSLAAIDAAATSAGNTVGFSPADVDKTIAAAVAVSPVPVGPFEFRYQRRAVVGVDVAADAAAVDFVAGLPVDRLGQHHADQAQLQRHHAVRRRHQRKNHDAGRLHIGPPAALLGRLGRHHPGPVQQWPVKGAGPDRACQLRQPEWSVVARQ